jgi:hypothetical protein
LTFFFARSIVTRTLTATSIRASSAVKAAVIGIGMLIMSMFCPPPAAV